MNENNLTEVHKVVRRVSHPVHLCAGFPQGSGVGASAAEEPLEEATLPQGREGSPADSEDAGEGHSASTHRIHQISIKKKK